MWSTESQQQQSVQLIALNCILLENLIILRCNYEQGELGTGANGWLSLSPRLALRTEKMPTN